MAREGSFVTPNLTVGNNPASPLSTGYNGTGCDLARTRALGLAPSAGDVLRTAPYEYRQLNSVVSADYRINRSNSLEAGFEREDFRREYREREKTWENKVRLGYVNRGFEAGTLRVSYEYGSRRGSDFVAAPLADFYSSSLGPVPTAPTTNIGTWFRNVDQFVESMWPIAIRTSSVPCSITAWARRSTPASACKSEHMKFPGSEYGRNDNYDQMSPSVELNWQPSPSTSAYGFYSYQRGEQHQAGIQPNACVIGNFYYFFSDGSVQTNATGVAPPAPAGTNLARLDPASGGGERAIAVRDGLRSQPALSNQPGLGRVAKGSQHGHGSGRPLSAGPGHVGVRLHLFDRPVQRQIRVNRRGAGIECRAGVAGRRRVPRSRLRPECRSAQRVGAAPEAALIASDSTGSRTPRSAIGTTTASA